MTPTAVVTFRACKTERVEQNNLSEPISQREHEPDDASGNQKADNARPYAIEIRNLCVSFVIGVHRALSFQSLLLPASVFEDRISSKRVEPLR
ncbi:MAG: hypothetical protein AAFQ44_12420, partial [Pseudomonadota bacterium]